MNAKHRSQCRRIVQALIEDGECSNTYLSAVIGAVNPANRISDCRKLGVPIVDRWTKLAGSKFKLYKVGNKKAAREWLKAA